MSKSHATTRDRRRLVSWASEVARPGGEFEDGILRFPDPGVDQNIAYYRAIGGSKMTERSSTTFSMTSLDTPTLQTFLGDVAPAALDSPIVDVGGGDGRNALPWLERGYRRVVVVDAAGDALIRLRSRIARDSPAWLGRVLLVQADARSLPLEDGCAGAVLAVESLYYLNDDYVQGLLECIRVLDPAGRLLLVERDTEGALLMQLLYYGIEAMLRSHREGAVWDGIGAAVQTKAFNEAQLKDILVANGLEVISIRGTSLLAMVLGWMNGSGLLGSLETEVMPLRQLLVELGKSGRMRRCHVVIARPAVSGRVTGSRSRRFP